MAQRAPWLHGRSAQTKQKFLPAIHFTAGTEATPADASALHHVYPGQRELAALYHGYLALSKGSFRYTEQAGTEQLGQNHALLPCHSPPLNSMDKK